ncbi:MAG: PilZ domain-containing protein [Gaiellales bacterium]
MSTWPTGADATVNQPIELERVTVDPASSGSAMFHPVECHVLAVAGQTVALEAVEKHTTLRLPPTIDKAYLLFDRSERVIAFRGKLLTVDPPGDLRFVIEHPETRRVATRVTVDLQATITRPGGQVIAAHTVNLSADGILFAGAGEVAIGEIVSIALQLGDEGEPLATTATVVRNAGADRFAVQLVADDKAARRTLGVFALEHNRRLLHRKPLSSRLDLEPDF